MVLGTTSNKHLYSTSEGIRRSVNGEIDMAEFHLAPLVYDPDFYSCI